ncbi:MAG: hypothetical protein ABJO09_06265 [Hyphomicrobiales bacterium]
MRTIKSMLAVFALATALGGLGAIGSATEASAGTTKPMLKAEGKAYYQKKKAKKSAIYNWEMKAKAKYSAIFGSWERAHKTNFDCKRETHQGNDRKLWTCQAKGKPSAPIAFCKSGKITAKWAHQSKTGAKAGARDAWEKRAAAKHGMKYSFYKNAVKKHSTCGSDSRFPGKITCTLSGTACN